MGGISAVECPACGYAQELFGVGGGRGLLGVTVWTVSCPIAQVLCDVWVRDAPSADSDPCGIFLEAPAGPVGPCPACGGEHPLWDGDAAECPQCGAAGCEAWDAGMWD